MQDTIHRRIAVVLRESPSLTVSEIANAIKKPEGTVRLILYRHRDSLFGQDLGSKPMRWVLIGEVPPGRFVLNPGKGSKIHQVKRGRIDGHSAETAIANHDGRCGICGTTWPGGNGWSLDHDHNLEPYAPVRGVLCNTCNIGLGMFGDDLDRLRLAVDYLGGSRRG